MKNMTQSGVGPVPEFGGWFRCMKKSMRAGDGWGAIARSDLVQHAIFAEPHQAASRYATHARQHPYSPLRYLFTIDNLSSLSWKSFKTSYLNGQLSFN
jgi:hypothetical protein